MSSFHVTRISVFLLKFCLPQGYGWLSYVPYSLNIKSKIFFQTVKVVEEEASQLTEYDHEKREFKLSVDVDQNVHSYLFWSKKSKSNDKNWLWWSFNLIFLSLPFHHQMYLILLQRMINCLFHRFQLLVWKCRISIIYQKPCLNTSIFLFTSSLTFMPSSDSSSLPSSSSWSSSSSFLTNTKLFRCPDFVHVLSFNSLNCAIGSHAK